MANYEDAFLDSLGRASSAVTGLMKQINEPGWKEKMEFQTDQALKLYEGQRDADVGYQEDTQGLRKEMIGFETLKRGEQYEHERTVDYNYWEQGRPGRLQEMYAEVDARTVSGMQLMDREHEIGNVEHARNFATGKALHKWQVDLGTLSNLTINKQLHEYAQQNAIQGEHLARGRMDLAHSYQKDFLQYGYELSQEDREKMFEINKLSKEHDYVLKEDHLDWMYGQEKLMATWAKEQGIKYERGGWWGNKMNGFFNTNQGSDDYNLQKNKLIDESKNLSYERQLEIGRVDFEKRQLFNYDLMNSPTFQTQVPQEAQGGLLTMSAAISGIDTEGMDLNDPGQQAALMVALRANANSQASQMRYDQINVDFTESLAFASRGTRGAGTDMPDHFGIQRAKSRKDVTKGVNSLVGATALFTEQVDQALLSKSLGLNSEKVTEARSDAVEALTIIDKYLEHADWAKDDTNIATLNTYKTVYTNILQSLQD